MMKNNRALTHASGFGLVELMVSITLGLLLSAAVLQTFLAANTSYRIQDSLSQIQESSRYAIHFLGQDLRMAGYMGCASPSSVSVNIISRNPPADVVFDLDTIVVGSDNVDTTNSFNAVGNTDVLSLRRASNKSAQLTGNMASDNANIQIVDNNLGLVAGAYVLITDCVNADLFTATGVSRSAGKVTIAHANDVNTTNKLSKPYGPDAEVFGFESINYFVRDTGRTTSGGNPIRALYIQKRTLGSAGANPDAYELVEGVENLQVTYGEDTNDDRSIDRYVDGANVGSWADVLSVRVELLLASNEDNVVGKTGAETAQEITFNGANVVNNDGRYRKVITSVFAIRNKLP